MNKKKFIALDEKKYSSRMKNLFLVGQKTFWLLKKVGWKATFFIYLKTTWKGPMIPRDQLFCQNCLIIHTVGCKWVNYCPYCIMPYSMVWICVCHRKAGPLDTLTNKVCSRTPSSLMIHVLISQTVEFIIHTDY